MKNIFFYSIILLFSLISCNKNIYGIYNTRNFKDKSAFLQIKLNPNNTVEKTEIHTIKIYSRGKYIESNNKIICYLDSSETGFPSDTIELKIKGNKMFFIKEGKVNKNFYLVKQ